MSRRNLRIVLITMLVVLIAVALFGVMVAGIGDDSGFIAIIIGIPACFPIIFELARMDRAAKREKQKEEENLHNE